MTNQTELTAGPLFDKKHVRRWRREVWRACASQGFSPAEISAGLVLAAIVGVGTDPHLLSELTGLSQGYVVKVTKRLRDQRVVAGTTVRAAWMSGDDMRREVGAVLDIGVAAGVFSRKHVDPKRSAAQKARSPETRARGPRGPRVKVQPGAAPTIAKSNPTYGLPEWEKGK
jgi:hypothetical protein